MAVPSVLTSKLLDELTSSVPTGEAATIRGMLPAVYDELRRLAAGFLRNERPNHTLQPTALVHEAYLRVADQRHLTWQNRAQLLGIFARMMRRILISHARARAAEKRGGKEAVRITLDEGLKIYSAETADLLEIEEALQRLERLDPTQGKVVELRLFGGLTAEEIAKTLEISPTTVKREWAVAKRWLQRALSSSA